MNLPSGGARKPTECALTPRQRSRRFLAHQIDTRAFRTVYPQRRQARCAVRSGDYVFAPTIISHSARFPHRTSKNFPKKPQPAPPFHRPTPPTHSPNTHTTPCAYSPNDRAECPKSAFPHSHGKTHDQPP